MLYKNSVKLLTSSFGLVWKQLAFSIICLAVSLLGSYLLLQPVIACLADAGWIKELTAVFETVYVNFTQLGNVVQSVFLNFFKIISSNFASLWIYFVGMFLISYMLPTVLLNYSQFVLCKVVGDQMSSMMQSGYTKTLFEDVKTALAYAVSKFIYDLPFIIVKLGVVFLYIALAKSFVMTIVMLSISSLLFITIEAVRLTVFSCFAGYVIESGKNPFKAFFKSVGIAFKQFARVFSNAVAALLSIIFINSFIGLFTVLSGLLVTVPASMVFSAIFYQVVYFSMQGRRYYLTNSIIVNPVK